MKTLGKLKINSEKVLNVDELKNLKGGETMCYVFYNGELVNDFPCQGSTDDCNEACDIVVEDPNPGYQCFCY